MTDHERIRAVAGGGALDFHEMPAVAAIAIGHTDPTKPLISLRIAPHPVLRSLGPQTPVIVRSNQGCSALFGAIIDNTCRVVHDSDNTNVR